MWIKVAVVVFVLNVIFAKKSHRGYQKHKERKGRSHIPRFKIPSPVTNREVSDGGTPEEITIVKKSKTIKDSELPGAFGEDDELTDIFQNSGSGSGSGSAEEIHIDTSIHHHDKIAENAANFGSNVPPKPGINPSAASITHEENHDGFKGADKDIGEGVKSHKKLVKHKKQKSKISKSAHAVKNNTKDSAHQKDNDIITQIQNIAKQIDAVEKKREKEKKKEKLKGKINVGKEKATRKKVDTVIEKIENDITKYQLDKDKSTKNSHGKKKSDNEIETKVDKVMNSESNIGEKSKQDKMNNPIVNGNIRMNSSSNQEESPPAKSEVSAIPHGDAGGPEGFECPWACFWTCHSYCPKECCYNPFKCQSICREFCTPYCNDKCCAPGTRRLPKLQLSFKTSAETGDSKATEVEQPITTEVDKSKAPEIQNAKAAEFPVQKQQVNQQGVAILSHLQALKQASAYAAQMIGLPQHCPLFCTRICTPSLCKAECCDRSTIRSSLNQHLFTAQVPPLPPLPQTYSQQTQQSSNDAYISAPAPIPPAIEEIFNQPNTDQISESQTKSQQATIKNVGTQQSLAPPAPVPAQASTVPQVSAQHSTQPTSAQQVTVQQGSTQQVAAQQDGTQQTSVQQATVQAEGSKPQITQNVTPQQGISQASVPQVTTNNVEILPQIATNIPKSAPQTKDEVSPPSQLNQAIHPQQQNAPESTTTINVPVTESVNSVPESVTKSFYCPTPIGCPEGGVVDPDYCPPICRTACIEQCPNECCPNSGHPVTQPKH